MISDLLTLLIVFFIPAIICNNYLCRLFLIGNYSLNFIFDWGKHEEGVKEVLETLFFDDILENLIKAVRNKISIDLFRFNFGSFTFLEIIIFEAVPFVSLEVLEEVPAVAQEHLLFCFYFLFSSPTNIFIAVSSVITLFYFLPKALFAFFQLTFDLFTSYFGPFAASVNHNTANSSSFSHFDFSKSYALD
jgi:hypothetical protein